MRKKIRPYGEVLEFLSDVPMNYVSNRAPYEHQYKDGDIVEIPKLGGLATASNDLGLQIGPPFTWTAWASGEADEEFIRKNHIRGKKDVIMVPRGAGKDSRYKLQYVFLTDDQVDNYYNGFSNRVLWPLFHEGVDVEPAWEETKYWEVYKDVNRMFAGKVAKNGSEEIDFIHDYHLLLMPEYVREKNPKAIIPMFLHIPWPSKQSIERMPEEWRKGILRGVASTDLFATHVYKHDVLSTINDCISSGDLKARIDGRGRIVVEDKDGGGNVIGERKVTIRNYPLGIDFEKWDELSRKSEYRTPELKDKTVILGVDRLDFTKAIDKKIHSLGRFLAEHPEYKEKVVFYQVLPSSRTKIEEYRDYGDLVKKTQESVNKEFGTDDWKPVILADGKNPDELAGLYKNADVFFATSLREGLGLCPKEFAASQTGKKNGSLILGKFSGVEKELGDYSLVVNPNDVEQMGKAIYRAVEMPAREKSRRMIPMKRRVEDHDINWWFREIMTDVMDIRNERNFKKTVF